MRCTALRGLPVAALALVLTVLADAPAPAQPVQVPGVVPEPVPVPVGGSAELDACTAVGKVSGLNPKGDNFLAVRSGPGMRFPKLDELRAGAHVILCAERSGWLGIVYTLDDALDCGVSTPRPQSAPYRGPCRSGWVAGRYITPLAG